MPTLKSIDLRPALISKLKGANVKQVSSIINKTTGFFTNKIGVSEELMDGLKQRVATRILWENGGAQMEMVNCRALAFRAAEAAKAKTNNNDDDNDDDDIYNNIPINNPSGFITGSASALNLLQSESLMYKNRPILMSGSTLVDYAISSSDSASTGLQFGKVTEIAGPAGSGKTQIALSLVARGAMFKGVEVYYFCAGNGGGVSSLVRRLNKIMQALMVDRSAKNVKVTALKKVKVKQVSTGHDMLMSLCQLDAELQGRKTPTHGSTSILVLDSVGGLLAKSMLTGGFGNKGTALLNDVSYSLRRITRDHGMATLLLNNTLTDGSPSLGRAWEVTADIRAVLRAPRNLAERGEAERQAERQGSLKRSHSVASASSSTSSKSGNRGPEKIDLEFGGHIAKHFGRKIKRKGKFESVFEFCVGEGGVIEERVENGRS
ncbi:hypothetical protein TrLO_g11933 [Triparma laevis f. longispina]|uniref:P-loop containing nucleoside triphosphate hydrolase protein n=1 Tax=Triparma laevis f. longispina TaxID=1714387 RepID=A0A9W7FQK6_9STRA|nr:hypothetical protein TrLO_g11933 [Triparma laevis f. longispina]